MKAIDHAYCFINTLVRDYFGSGRLRPESAYAVAALALIYLEAHLGIDRHSHLVEMYEEGLASGKDFFSVMFPDDETIRKHLDDLEDLLEWIEGSQGKRNILMHIVDEPGLRLVYSKPAK